MRLRTALTFTAALAASVTFLAPTLVSAGPTTVLARFDKDEKPKKDDKGKKGKGKEKAPEGPAVLEKAVRLAPKGLAFQAGVKEISALYAKIFDEEYLPLYKRVQPGPRMQALDAELADKKELLKRNVIAFGSTPTGIDYTALKGEYSYRNKESMTHLVLRNGTKRHFFFFDDKLWKVYDEYQLDAKGPLGESFTTAVEKLTKKLKIAPRLREAGSDPALGFTTADWQDSSMIIRVLDRGDGTVAVVYVDRSVEENLDKYRTAAADDPNAIDRDVENATEKKKAEPEKGKDKDKKKK